MPFLGMGERGFALIYPILQPIFWNANMKKYEHIRAPSDVTVWVSSHRKVGQDEHRALIKFLTGPLFPLSKRQESLHKSVSLEWSLYLFTPNMGVYSDVFQEARYEEDHETISGVDGEDLASGRGLMKGFRLFPLFMRLSNIYLIRRSCLNRQWGALEMEYMYATSGMSNGWKSISYLHHHSSIRTNN